MKKLFFLLIIIFFSGCNKPKTVLICGDHICINKAEAEQHFKENLSLEIQVIDNKKKESVDLVKLNLEKNSSGDKKVYVLNKKKSKKMYKILSNNEIKIKKAQIKKKEKENKFAKKTSKNTSKKIKLSKKNQKEKLNNNVLKLKKTVNKPNKEIVDICTILDKCSIDEISKYLIKQGKNKNYPDVSIKE